MISAPTPLLSIEHLSIGFPDERDGQMQAVVRDSSFTVDRNEIVGLVGESGSGKTQTAMAILRLTRPPGRVLNGRILLDGHDILAMNDAELRRVRNILARARKALDAGDHGALGKANEAFHDEILKLSRNTLLQSMLEPLQGRLHRLLRQTGDPYSLLEEHTAWFEAIASGDPALAAKEMPRLLASGFKGMIAPRSPYRLDFVMLPAATIDGRLVDATGSPLAKRTLCVTGKDLPPSTSVLTTVVTDREGRFRVEDVPLRRFEFVLRGERREETRSAPVDFAQARTYRLEVTADEPQAGQPRLQVKVLGAR